jgi:hypothetical protein
MPNNKSTGVAYEDPQLDGAVMGKTGGTAGFFGATPTNQLAALTSLNFSTLTTATVGALTTSQISALQTNVNGIITGLKSLGIMASS